MLASSAIEIVIVGSRLLFREALAALLTLQPDFKVTAHVPTIDDALRIALTTPVQCVVVQFESDQNDFSSLCLRLRDLGKHARIVLAGTVMRLQELNELRTFVAGILPDSATSTLLIEAVRRISIGQTWRDLPYLDGSTGLPHGRSSPVLTPRQQMVLHLVCEGLSNKEAAEILHVSGSAIKCTIQQLFQKTNTRSRAQLVRRAMEEIRDIAICPPRQFAQGQRAHENHASAC